RDGRANDHAHDGQQRGHDDVRPPTVEPSERAREHEHGDEAGHALHEVHHGERVRTDALEEQRVDAALADRESRGSDEQEADDRTDHAAFAGSDPKDVREGAHAPVTLPRKRALARPGEAWPVTRSSSCAVPIARAACSGPARNGMNRPTISSPTNFSMIASPSIRTRLDSR